MHHQARGNNGVATGISWRGEMMGKGSARVRVGRGIGRVSAVRVEHIELLERRTLLSASPFDPTFGMGGTVRTQLPGTAGGVASAVLVRSDGSIVAAGTILGSSSSFGIAQFKSDGTLDRSFGTVGAVDP